MKRALLVLAMISVPAATPAQAVLAQEPPPEALPEGLLASNGTIYVVTRTHVYSRNVAEPDWRTLADIPVLSAGSPGVPLSITPLPDGSALLISDSSTIVQIALPSRKSARTARIGK